MRPFIKGSVSIDCVEFRSHRTNVVFSFGRVLLVFALLRSDQQCKQFVELSPVVLVGCELAVLARLGVLAVC